MNETNYRIIIVDSKMIYYRVYSIIFTAVFFLTYGV